MPVEREVVAQLHDVPVDPRPEVSLLQQVLEQVAVLPFLLLDDGRQNREPRVGLERRDAASRVDEILEFAELEPFANQKLKHFSSGMTVRLAFAITTHVEADVLAFDEVLAVGDAAFHTKCFEHFDRLREEGFR